MHKISINDTKLIRSLTIKKYRQQYKKFVVEGEKLTVETIKYKSKYINSLYCTDFFADKYESLLSENNIGYKITEERELVRVSNFKTNSSALMVVDYFDHFEFIINSEYNIIVYLDNISDPGNLGTIIRTCEWFGVDLVVASPNCVDFYNPKVVQASMGSLLRINFTISEFDELILKNKDKTPIIYGMLLEGDDIYSTNIETPCIIVIGNESIGISDTILKKLTHSITITGESKEIDSLNAAISTSVVLSELFRRKKDKNV